MLLVPPTQCNGSGMFMTDPRFLILLLYLPDPESRIQDSTTGKEKGEENFCLTFLLSHKIFYFWTCIEKFLANRQRILVIFLPKILPLCSQKYGLSIRDPRSGIQNPDPGVKLYVPDPGSGTRPDHLMKIRIQFLWSYVTILDSDLSIYLKTIRKSSQLFSALIYMQ